MKNRHSDLTVGTHKPLAVPSDSDYTVQYYQMPPLCDAQYPAQVKVSIGKLK